MTFIECLRACAAHSELVENFNRLTGSRLGIDRSPVEALVDQATGYEEVLAAQQAAQCAQFVQFVFDAIWTRLPPEARAEA